MNDSDSDASVASTVDLNESDKTNSFSINETLLFDTGFNFEPNSATNKSEITFNSSESCIQFESDKTRMEENQIVHCALEGEYSQSIVDTTVELDLCSELEQLKVKDNYENECSNDRHYASNQREIQSCAMISCSKTEMEKGHQNVSERHQNVSERHQDVTDRLNSAKATILYLTTLVKMMHQQYSDKPLRISEEVVKEHQVDAAALNRYAVLENEMMACAVKLEQSKVENNGLVLDMARLRRGLAEKDEFMRRQEEEIKRLMSQVQESKQGEKDLKALQMTAEMEHLATENRMMQQEEELNVVQEALLKSRKLNEELFEGRDKNKGKIQYMQNLKNEVANLRQQVRGLESKARASEALNKNAGQIVMKKSSPPSMASNKMFNRLWEENKLLKRQLKESKENVDRGNVKVAFTAMKERKSLQNKKYFTLDAPKRVLKRDAWKM